MDKNEQRLTLAGNALQGLLASQPADQGWEIGALAVASLNIADAVLHFSTLEKLPDLREAKPEPEPEPAIVIQPTIITPRE
jgi:hypothetical protein